MNEYQPSSARFTSQFQDAAESEQSQNSKLVKLIVRGVTFSLGIIFFVFGLIYQIVSTSISVDSVTAISLTGGLLFFLLGYLEKSLDLASKNVESQQDKLSLLEAKLNRQGENVDRLVDFISYYTVEPLPRSDVYKVQSMLLYKSLHRAFMMHLGQDAPASALSKEFYKAYIREVCDDRNHQKHFRWIIKVTPQKLQWIDELLKEFLGIIQQTAPPTFDFGCYRGDELISVQLFNSNAAVLINAAANVLPTDRYFLMTFKREGDAINKFLLGHNEALWAQSIQIIKDGKIVQANLEHWEKVKSAYSADHASSG